MQYLVITEDIIPIVRANINAPLLELYLQLQMSLIFEIMLLIFLLFESFPNALAELTCYADREFYQDWWNARSVEELYGKWLRFFYLFHYRHVYMRLQVRYRFGQTTAKVIANIVNSVMQELIMVRNMQINTFKGDVLLSLWLLHHKGTNCGYDMVLHPDKVQAF